MTRKRTRLTKVMTALIVPILCAIVACLQMKKNNPLLTDYEGDYKLEIKWTSLPVALDFGVTYPLHCIVGADTFASFTVPDSLEQYVNMTVLAKSTNDTIFLCFTKVFHDTLAIFGVRPNGKEVRAATYLVVKDPNRPKVTIDPQIFVGFGQNPISIVIADTAATTVQLYWKMKSDGIVDSLSSPRAPGEFVLPIDVTLASGWDTLSLWSVDVKTGLVSDTMRTALNVSGQVPNVTRITLPDTIACGSTLTATLLFGDIPASEFRVIVQGAQRNDSAWRDTSAATPYQSPASVTMNYLITDTGLVSFTSYCLDGSNVRSMPFADSVFVKHIPVVAKFMSTKLSVGKGEKTTISVVDSFGTCAKFVWKIGASDSETTTVNKIVRSFTDTLGTIVTAYGIDKFGYAGKRDEAIVSVGTYAYSLTEVQGIFPDMIIAKHRAAWKVAVDDSVKLLDNRGKYFWKFTSGGKDSVTSGEKLDSFSVTLADSTAAAISVWVKDEYGGSSFVHSLPIAVRLFKPELRFEKSVDTTRIGVGLVLRARVHDTNEGGAIDSIYWDVNGDGKTDKITRDTFVVFSYDKPSTWKVTAFARDNDGNYSRIDTATILVKSDKPVFDKQTDDTVVFVNTAAMLHASAVPGEMNVAIAEYAWKLRGATQLDTTTTKSSFSRVFNTVGQCTVIVSCKDKDQVASKNADTFTVTISQGNPVVSGIKPDSVFAFAIKLYTVSAREINPAGRLDSFFVQWEQGGVFEAKKDSLFQHKFTSAGMKRVRIFAKDAGGYPSDTVTDSVYVDLGQPRVITLTVDTARTAIFVGDKRKFMVKGRDPDGGAGGVDSLAIIWAPSLKTTKKAQGDSAEILRAFGANESGRQTIKAVAVDVNGIMSDTLFDTVNVRLGQPTVTNLQPQTVWVNAAAVFTVSATDSNGAVDSIVVDWGDSTSQTRALYAAPIKHKYAISQAGQKTVKIVVIDNDGVYSELLRDTVSVDLGKPKVTAITVDTALESIFINDNRTFTASVSDTNGTVDSIMIDNGSGAFGAWQTVSGGKYAFTRKFALVESGNRIIRAAVKDNDGVVSDTFALTVNVRLGKPLVYALSPQTVWVNDDTTFTITAHDTNGKVDSLIIDWGDAAAATRTQPGQAIHHKYAIAKAGINTVAVVAKDNDGVLSDTLKVPVTVNLGAPVVDAISPATVWVNDDTTFKISAHDPNGTIDSFEIDWANDGAYEIKSGVESVKHKFDTTQSGSHTVRVRVMDDDSLWTGKDLSVQVKMGRPVLRGKSFGDSIQWARGNGGALDTMFYVLTGANTTMRIDTVDSNGQCKLYFWDFYNDGSLNATTTTTTTTNGFAPNTANALRVYCKDDDSLASAPLICVVYPDAPPPTTTTTTSQPGYPNVRLAWFGLDAHDDSLTQFAVVVGASAGAVTDTVVNFTAAKSAVFGKGGGLITYTFNPQTRGISSNFYFKIIARDARGSMPMSISPAFVTYPY
jgi:hypothetical protein